MGHDTALVADWEAVAPGWIQHREQLSEHLRPVAERMLQLLAPRPGEEVVELAAGTGELSRALARAVTPGGTVVCSDAVPAMVEAARRHCEDTPGVETRVLDLQAPDLPDDVADAVACRMGLALVEEPGRAAVECRRLLRPGGRFVVATWGSMVDNPWLTLLGIGLLTNGHPLPGDPTGPGGVFSLASPDDLHGLLSDAGFEEVHVEPVEVPDHHASFEDLWRLRAETSGPLTTVLRRLSEAEVRDVRASCAEHAARYAAADGSYTLPGRALVALAR